MKNKTIWIVAGVVLAGAAFYYFKNRSFKKKYEVIEDRDFEILVAKQ